MLALLTFCGETSKLIFSQSAAWFIKVEWEYKLDVLARDYNKLFFMERQAFYFKEKVVCVYHNSQDNTKTHSCYNFQMWKALEQVAFRFSLFYEMKDGNIDSYAFTCPLHEWNTAYQLHIINNTILMHVFYHEVSQTIRNYDK